MLTERSEVGPASPEGRPGLFVVLEGGEGVGKTTQVDRLATYLRQIGRVVTVTREPGGTELGARLRTFLLSASVPPRAEALLYLADRALHAERVIAPALARGEIVISDRFADSNVVYQGVGRGLGPARIAGLSAWAAGGVDGVRPDLVVVLDMDPAVGLARVGRRAAADRIESEDLAFHRRVRAGFLEVPNWTWSCGRRYIVVDADRPPYVVGEQIAGEVMTMLLDRRVGRRPEIATTPG